MAGLRMAKAYRPYLPEQDLLLPQNVRDWLPEDHLAHFVSDVVDELDLSAIESVYEKEERGQSFASYPYGRLFKPDFSDGLLSRSESLEEGDLQ